MKYAVLNSDVHSYWVKASPETTKAICEFNNKARGKAEIVWIFFDWLHKKEGGIPKAFQARDLNDVLKDCFEDVERRPVLPMEPDDWIVSKGYSDATRKTGLINLLKNLEVKDVFICGYETSDCALSTAFALTDDFNPALLTDLTSDRPNYDPIKEGTIDRFHRYGIKTMDSSDLAL